MNDNKENEAMRHFVLQTGAKTFNVMTFGIMDLIVMLSKQDTEHKRHSA
jgi:hypothetical protein